MPNRLAQETSPYLLQHRDNPVDWYPWGPEAFERAVREDRPVLLSVGYSACHWCHVMEHESFEDEATARLMNEHFVNIKVDREERPDVDSIYMSAVQQMTGHGGWPMTVFLTPEAVPFYGGTYFPPAPRHGLPSFQQILTGVSQAYREKREQVQQSASQLHEALRQSSAVQPRATPLEPGLLDRAFDGIASRFDARYGGFGATPKFPQPMILEFLLRYWRRTGRSEALSMAQQTLTRMWRGGMYDQIGGGFHRYSVDARWLVPHFEKMLYDNALLSRVYLQAHQATGDREHRRVVEEVLDYVVREMLSPEGGFYSTQDADSEGEEGKFYVWSAAEVDELLGAKDGELFRRYYDVSPGGNFEGHNILNVARGPEEVAAELGVEPEALEGALARSRAILYEARASRIWPDRDEKVITAWNGMMLRSFSEAARLLKRDDYRAVAEKNAAFLLDRLRPEGRLRRTYKDGQAKIDAFLEDYALLIDGLISLYEATFEPRWIREATELARTMLEGFWEPEERTFYDTARDAEALIVRPTDIIDNATPSGNSAATRALQRLAMLTGEPLFDQVPHQVLERLGALAGQLPHGFGELLSALDVEINGGQEIAIIGNPAAADTAALLATLAQLYLPGAVVALRDPRWPAERTEAVGLLADRPHLEDRATAFVCRRHTCRAPTSDPQELRAQLDAMYDRGAETTAH